MSESPLSLPHDGSVFAPDGAFTVLADSMSDPVVVIGLPERQVTHGNRSATDWAGRENLAGTAFDDLFPGLTAEQTNAIFSELLSTGTASFRHERIRRGSVCESHTVACRLIETGGRSDMLCVMCRCEDQRPRHAPDRMTSDAMSAPVRDILTTIVATLSYPLYVVDVNDYTVLLANDDTPIDPGERRTCHALLHGSPVPCRDMPFCPIAEMRASGGPVVMEFVPPGPDGIKRCMEIRGHPVFDMDGELALAILSIFDVTLRKRAETALTRSEDRFRELFENMNTGIALVTVDKQGRHVVRDCNPALQRFTGATPEDIVGKEVSEAFPCMSIQGVGSMLADVLRTGRQIVRPAAYLSSANPGWRELSAFRINEGEVALVVHDVNQRKHFEDERDRLFNLSLDMLAIMGFDGFLKQINPAWQRTLGWSDGELLATPLIEFVHIEDRDQVHAADAKLRDGNRVQDFETRIQSADGSFRWISWSMFPLPDAAVSFNVGRDITANKILEEQYIQSQKLETVGRLAGGVAHDFNNLLTVIRGNAELGLLHAGEENREYYLEIRDTADSAAGLVRQLLAFSRKQIVKPRTVDLGVVLTDMRKLLCRLIGEDIELVTDAASGLWKVRIDTVQIEQVFTNLAINARDAMPEGGTLIIRLENAVIAEGDEAPPGEYVRIEVSDTGIGMSEEVRERLFEPFFTTKEPGKGTGLGLSTCYGIVRQSGGHIGVKSEPGRGATFHILIPRHHGKEETRTSEEVVPMIEHGTGTVLVAEDEPLLRSAVTRMLAEAGYTVLEAQDGIEALTLASGGATIDLVVTDMIMPRMGGRELAKAIRSKHPDVRFLYMSGYDSDSDVTSPGEAFIQKPFSITEFSQAVSGILQD